MNNKVLSVILVLGIASTGFAGISSANSGKTLNSNSSQMEQGVRVINKAENHHFGKRKGQKHLTDEEKKAFKSMNSDEKKSFFQAKHQEMKAQKEDHKLVIDKLIKGESLTAAQEASRLEMLSKIEEYAGKHRKSGSDIIAKLLAGDQLTVDEELELEAMKVKHTEREAQRELMEVIKEKLNAGEALSGDEQALLEGMKANTFQGKRKHK